MWFPNRSDTNRPVQSQKQARSLKFWISEEEKVYYPCSENKGADQLRSCSYCEADLRLCFRIGKNPVFLCRGSYDVQFPLSFLFSRETTSFLKQYKLQRSVKTALSQLELDQMEVHQNAELVHLNSIAHQRKTSCENNIRTVMEDVSKVGEELWYLMSIYFP